MASMQLDLSKNVPVCFEKLLKWTELIQTNLRRFCFGLQGSMGVDYSGGPSISSL
jgi:hypothetical protein